jgi:hypothetical protein
MKKKKLEKKNIKIMNNKLKYKKSTKENKQTKLKKKSKIKKKNTWSNGTCCCPFWQLEEQTSKACLQDLLCSLLSLTNLQLTCLFHTHGTIAIH